jgi:hypothetical protein
MTRPTIFSTLTGGHGVFMTDVQVDEVEDWYDPDNDWYDSDNNLQIPLVDSYGAHGICLQNLNFFDSFDQAVWAYFKPADDETIETITSTIAEL